VEAKPTCRFCPRLDPRLAVERASLSIDVLLEGPPCPSDTAGLSALSSAVYPAGGEQ
jgi:hypothetical protein